MAVLNMKAVPSGLNPCAYAPCYTVGSYVLVILFSQPLIMMMTALPQHDDASICFAYSSLDGSPLNNICYCVGMCVSNRLTFQLRFNDRIVCCCRVGENGDWDEDVSGIELGTNKTSYWVSNLRPFTVYSFRIIAVNALGPSKASKESYYMVTLREGQYKLQTKLNLCIFLLNAGQIFTQIFGLLCR
jgi:hypothetical protein